MQWLERHKQPAVALPVQPQHHRATQRTLLHIQCQVSRNVCHPRATHLQLAHHIHGALAEVERDGDLVFPKVVVLQRQPAEGNMPAQLKSP